MTKTLVVLVALIVPATAFAGPGNIPPGVSVFSQGGGAYSGSNTPSITSTPLTSHQIHQFGIMPIPFGGWAPLQYPSKGNPGRAGGGCNCTHAGHHDSGVG